MTKRKTKYRTSITSQNGTTYGNFESDDGMTTVIRKKGGRAKLKRIRKKRIGAK